MCRGPGPGSCAIVTGDDSCLCRPSAAQCSRKVLRASVPEDSERRMPSPSLFHKRLFSRALALLYDPLAIRRMTLPLPESWRSPRLARSTWFRISGYFLARVALRCFVTIPRQTLVLSRAATCCRSSAMSLAFHALSFGLDVPNSLVCTNGDAVNDSIRALLSGVDHLLSGDVGGSLDEDVGDTRRCERRAIVDFLTRALRAAIHQAAISLCARCVHVMSPIFEELHECWSEAESPPCSSAMPSTSLPRFSPGCRRYAS
jgi:hypothetical protein